MARRRVGMVALVVGVAGGASIGPIGVRAGHENVVLTAELSGAAEVGDDGSSGVGDPDGAGSAKVFGIDGDPTTLCYVITATGIDPTFEPGEVGMAHIHRGAEGENGPVVAALAFPLEGDSADCITEGEEDKFPLIGEADEPESIVADILANPASYYVNVHTGEFPAGAIRGQLADVHAAGDDHPMTESSAPATSVEPTATDAGAAATEVAVEISDFAFNAAEVRVAVGGTVTWTNSDSQQHTATAAGAFDTGTIEPGASASVTFDEAGTFAYFCAFHPFMTGTVIVG